MVKWAKKNLNAECWEEQSGCCLEKNTNIPSVYDICFHMLNVLSMELHYIRSYRMSNGCVMAR